METPYLGSIVHPRAEFEVTSLIIKRKVLNIDRAGRPELCRRRPENISSVINCRQTSEVGLRIIVSAEIKHNVFFLNFEMCFSIVLRGLGPGIKIYSGELKKTLIVRKYT